MAKVVREEDLRLNILLGKGDEARKKILDLEEAVRSSTDRVKEMRKEQEMLSRQNQTGSQHYKELTAAIKAEQAAIAGNKKQIGELRGQMKVTDMTIAELTQGAKKLRLALASAAPGTENFKRLQGELSQVNTRLVELKKQAASTETAIKGIGGSVTKALGMAQVGIMAAASAFRAISGAITTIADFEQELFYAPGLSAGHVIDTGEGLDKNHFFFPATPEVSGRGFCRKDSGTRELVPFLPRF